MPTTASAPDVRSLTLGTLTIAATVAAGWWVSRAPLQAPLLLLVGLSAATLALLRIEWAIHALIVAMLWSPELSLGGPLGAGSLDASRSAVLRLDDVLLVAIGVSWLARCAVYRQFGLLTRTRLNAPILTHVCVLVVSTALGAVAGRVQPLIGAAYLIKLIEYLFVFFVIVHHVRDRQTAYRLLTTATLTAVAVSLYAIAGIPGGDRVSAPFEGPRGEPNTLGGYLVLVMSVLGGIALETTGRLRWALTGAIAIASIPLVYTLSRSSWLAALTGGCVLLLVTHRRNRKLMAATLAVAGVLVLVALPDRAVERVEYTFTEHRESVRVGELTLDASTSDRVRSWSESFTGFLRHPLLGHGVTGYHFIDAQYFRVLAETGVAGALAFGWLVIALGRESLQLSRAAHSTLLRGMAAGLVAALAALLVHALGTNTFIIVRIMEPFWLFAGLVIALSTVERRDVRTC